MMIFVVMGPCGSGKSFTGKKLSEKMGWKFIEGDLFHPSENVAKMARGVPLEDEDRWPWLDVLHAEIMRHVTDGENLVVSCSALKQAYRSRLKSGICARVVFILLAAPRLVLEKRVKARSEHYMPPNLVASQLQALEPFASEEDSLIVDSTKNIDYIVNLILQTHST